MALAVTLSHYHTNKVENKESLIFTQTQKRCMKRDEKRRRTQQWVILSQTAFTTIFLLVSIPLVYIMSKAGLLHKVCDE